MAGPASFHFVEADGPSEYARRRLAAQEYSTNARKHVMRRIRQEKRGGQPAKRRRYERIELELVGSSDEPSSSGTESQSEGRQQTEFELGRVLATDNVRLPGLAKSLGSGRLDPFLPYPLELTPRARSLIDYLLDPKVTILRSFRLTWYPLLWTGDIAVFYQSLSNSCTALGKLLKLPRLLDEEATRYHTAALESVNTRIRDPLQYNSDGVVASIIGFAFHMTQTASAAHDVHMRGLQSIVDSRGGVDSVRPYHLRMMLFMVDVSGAARRDFRPRFKLPLQVLPSIDQLRPRFKPSDEVTTCAMLWLARFPDRSEIAQILQDLSIFTQWAESEAAVDPSFYLESNKSGEWVAPIIYRCLQLIPEDRLSQQERGCAMQEVLRHAIILFIQHIRRKFGIIVGGLEERLLKLKAAILECFLDWTDLEPMLRWALAAGAMEAINVDDKVWFAGQLATHPLLDNMPRNDLFSSLQSFIPYKGAAKHKLAELIFYASNNDMTAISVANDEEQKDLSHLSAWPVDD